MNVIAYFLNAHDGILRPEKLPINSKDQFAAIYRLIRCDRVDILKVWEHHFVFFDKDGLTDGLSCFTELHGHPLPIGGNMVVTGATEDEEITNPTATIEVVASNFLISRPVLNPDHEMINQPSVSLGRAFRPRLLRNSPVVHGETN